LSARENEASNKFKLVDDDLSDSHV